jgi:hypothetical protein
MSTTYKHIIGVVTGVVAAVGFLALSHIASAEEVAPIAPENRPVPTTLRERAEVKIDAIRVNREEERDEVRARMTPPTEKREMLREKKDERIASSTEVPAERAAKL